MSVPNTEIDRLQNLYNGDAYDSGSNPGGLADGGHRVNFVQALRDIATVCDFIGNQSNDLVQTAVRGALQSAQRADSALSMIIMIGQLAEDAANRAEAAAASGSLPGVTGGDVGKVLEVNSGGTGYTLGISRNAAIQNAFWLSTIS